ncbi:MAG: cobalamin B12-binding domain-containing protein [Pseudomonadota bacterium]
MQNSSINKGSGLVETKRPAIRFLVESALNTVMAKAASEAPRTRREWVERLTDALIADDDSSYRNVIAMLGASGTSPEELFQTIVPEAAWLLGDHWVNDRVTFVDVTVGASRLQRLFREHEADSAGRGPDRLIPLAQSVLIVVPQFEQHALGAFVTADFLRREGLHVHMAVGLSTAELLEHIRSEKFSMVGLTLATERVLNKTAKLVNVLREEADLIPPIVAGGRLVGEDQASVLQTGVDFAVANAKQAIERCGLIGISNAVPFSGRGPR